MRPPFETLRLQIRSLGRAYHKIRNPRIRLHREIARIARPPKRPGVNSSSAPFIIDISHSIFRQNQLQVIELHGSADYAEEADGADFAPAETEVLDETEEAGMESRGGISDFAAQETAQSAVVFGEAGRGEDCVAVEHGFGFDVDLLAGEE